ncbi:hypothetical protein J5226_21960 [Lysobacter sp. K5869]|uniref:hypothetical protein n=1 Tax=Lysobacter sp. K5869 TaxID=2820808 RepID=UPI001C063FB0|nr:hypothetical protein [Lysobacter sp. K5869]QWP76223.1 hypothetical protein J5226_21960 [Lysobacter sp. K5869]
MSDEGTHDASEELQVLNSLDVIRRRAWMFLPDDEPLDLAIVTLLLETALRQGVAPLTVRSGGGFRSLGADYDWLWRSEDGEPYVFDRLVPLPGGIQNSFRGEILLTAFAPFWAAVSDGRVVYKSSQGFDDARVLREAAGAGAFVVLVAEGTLATSQG